MRILQLRNFLNCLNIWPSCSILSYSLKSVLFFFLSLFNFNSVVLPEPSAWNKSFLFLYFIFVKFLTHICNSRYVLLSGANKDYYYYYLLIKDEQSGQEGMFFFVFKSVTHSFA